MKSFAIYVVMSIALVLPAAAATDSSPPQTKCSAERCPACCTNNCKDCSGCNPKK